MRDELLERFRKNNFDSLTREEKEKLVIETIKAIQHEQELSELDIKFEDEKFGYDRINKAILIDLNEDNDSYTILTGIIHELRHQYQHEKLGMHELPYSTKTIYALDPKEVDAHEYAISEMSRYADFFNEDDFDIHVLKLRDQFDSKRKSVINQLKILGYKDEEIETIAKQMDDYGAESTLISIKDALSGKDDVPEELVEFDDGLRARYKLYFNNNMSIMFPGLHMNIIGNDIYITHMTIGKSLNVKDFTYLLQGIIDDLKEFKEIGLDINVENVHFQPVIMGLNGVPKDEYEAFLTKLGCKNKTISVNDLYTLNIDENYTYKRTTPVLPDGMKLLFGINYRQEYTEEQLKVLDEVNEFRFDLEDMMEEGSNDIKAFVACCQYRPEYSAKKMKLILEGQKRGLNTLHYESLDEAQIEQLMSLQLGGAKRKDWIDIVKSGRNILETNGKKEITPIQAARSFITQPGLENTINAVSAVEQAEEQINRGETKDGK